MNKSDLRTGMVVEDGEGILGVVLLNTATEDGIKWFLNEDKESFDYWEELDNYNEDLTNATRRSEDIVKIYNPYDFDDYLTQKSYYGNYIIWEREVEKTEDEKEVREITMKDIEEKFGCKIKIVD